MVLYRHTIVNRVYCIVQSLVAKWLAHCMLLWKPFNTAVDTLLPEREKIVGKLCLVN